MPDKTLIGRKGYSSDLLPLVPYNLEKYTQILNEQTRILQQKYKDNNLFQVFKIMPNKLLTVGPIAVCDYLTIDLNHKCPEKVLATIGLLCLQISTHDDAVDETPSSRNLLAALIYAGNIASLEGVRLLVESGHGPLASELLKIVNRNHFLQQKRVELLWDNSPRNFLDYRIGVADGAELIKIGAFAALHLCNAGRFKDRLSQFAENYALALQLLDDIREVEEDKKSGYHSFPLMEHPPFKLSFKHAKENLQLASNCLRKEWVLTKSLVESVGAVLDELEQAFQTEKTAPTMFQKLGIEYFKNFIVLATGVLSNSQDKILLLKRSLQSKTFPGFWQLPEGKMEFGEQAQQTLEREVKEELGCQLLGITTKVAVSLPYTIGGEKFHLLRIVMMAKLKGKITLSKEAIAYKWLDKEEILKIGKLVPGTRELL